jgi:hypothetical protein
MVFSNTHLESHLNSIEEPLKHVYDMPFESLNTTAKGKPLELVMDELHDYYQQRFGSRFQYKDLTSEHKSTNHKGDTIPDYLMENLAVVEELKNWEFYKGKGYEISKRDIDNQILPRFSKYPAHFRKILVIANPKWEKGAKAYLQSFGVFVIEIGFQVTFDLKVMEKAKRIIKAQMDALFGLAKSIGRKSLYLNLVYSITKLPITSLTDNIRSKFSSFLDRISVLKAKTKFKAVVSKANSDITSGDPEPNSKTQEEAGDSALAFNGVEISNDKISSIWVELESTSNLPTIKAFKLTKEEFLKVVDLYVTVKAKKDGYSDSEIDDAVKSGGLLVQFPTEYCILLIEDTPEKEQRVLVRELVKIAWRDWGQNATDCWREYID